MGSSAAEQQMSSICFKHFSLPQRSIAVFLQLYVHLQARFGASDRRTTETAAALIPPRAWTGTEIRGVLPERGGGHLPRSLPTRLPARDQSAGFRLYRELRKTGWRLPRTCGH